MTIEQWKSNPGLTQEMRKIMSLPAFEKALSVLRESAPQNDVLTNQECTNNAAFLLGKVVGYNFFEQRLRSLAEIHDEVQTLVATYGEGEE